MKYMSDRKTAVVPVFIQGGTDIPVCREAEGQTGMSVLLSVQHLAYLARSM